MDNVAMIQEFQRMREAIVAYYDERIQVAVQSLLAEKENMLRNIDASIELVSNSNPATEQLELIINIDSVPQQPISLIKAVESILPDLPETFTINEVIGLINRKHVEHRNPNPTSISGVLRKLTNGERPQLVRLVKGEGKLPSIYQVSRVAAPAHEDQQEEDVREAISA
jgi:hypothetical protein